MVFLPRATVGLVSRAAAKGAKVPKKGGAFMNENPLRLAVDPQT